MSAYLLDLWSAVTALVWVLVGIAGLTLLALILDAKLSSRGKW